MPIPIDSDAPNGWNSWIPIGTQIPEGNVFLADNFLDQNYTPSSAFWLRSLIDHCLLPWQSTPLDAYSLFLISGGGSGTIIGAIGGLAVVAEQLKLPLTSTFALGSNFPAPRFGFCLGTEFKHQAYLNINVIRNELPGAANDIVFGRLDLAQNSKFKKIYIHHGEVERFEFKNGEYILSIGLSKSYDQFINKTLKIITSEEKILNLKVESVDENGNLIFLNLNENTEGPSPGDYFEFNDVFCVEDPLLMSGFWLGSENDYPNSEFNHSGYNLFLTSHNKPYIEGKFTGLYTYFSVPDENELQLGQPTESLMPFNIGTPIFLNDGFEWRFLGTGEDAELYRDENRYIIDPSTGSYINIPKGSLNDYLNIVQDPLRYAFLRLEISSGGRENRHNWHAPALRGEFLKNNGSYFKILDHIEASIIDVSIISVDGKILDPFKNVNYSIFNQKAWIINEHYNGQVGTPEGVYKGKIIYAEYIKSQNKTIIELSDVNIPNVMNYEYKFFKPVGFSNSFNERFLKELDHFPENPVKLYSKYQNWKFIIGRSSYSIVSFSGLINSTINMEVSGDLSSFLNFQGFISFDEPFLTSGIVTPESAIFYSHTGKEGTNQICLNSEYTLGPYRLDLSENTRFGFCDGFWFGFGNEVASNSRVSSNFITTPSSSSCIASMYHKLLDEDWVLYLDSLSNKLTLRRGSLGFTDYPNKTEIVMGKNIESEYLGSGSVFNLNSSKGRLRRVLFKTPASSNVYDRAFYIKYGSLQNVYGFPISGNGDIKLRGISMSGINDTSLLDYKSDSINVSPIYIYKKGLKVEYRNVRMQDVGLDVRNSPLSFFNFYDDSSVFLNDFTAFYINENQTLGEDIGFFDILRLNDGENMIIYGSLINEFNIGDSVYNSSNSGNAWNNPNAVMALSSYNDSFKWGTPLRKDMEKDENFQYPLMLLNSVTYYTSFYDHFNNSIVIFARCLEGASAYIGCFRISFNNFLNVVYKCSSQTSYGFLYREPNLPEDSFLWTDERNVLNLKAVDSLLFKYNGVTKDNFSRVIGSNLTKSDIEFDENINIASSCILNDGTYVLVYDTSSGIRIAFSRNSGRFWKQSNIILSILGSGGVLINGNLYYVTPSSGVAVKYINEVDLYTLRDLSFVEQGSVDNIEEQKIQDKFNSFDVDLLGTGQINQQKISGYIDTEGTIRIYYYDLNNNLSSVYSNFNTKGKTNVKWILGENF